MRTRRGKISTTQVAAGATENVAQFTVPGLTGTVTSGAWSGSGYTVDAETGQISLTASIDNSSIEVFPFCRNENGVGAGRKVTLQGAVIAGASSAIPGMNFGNPDSFADSNYYVNRLYQARFDYYDNATSAWQQSVPDIAADGFSTGATLTGTRRLVMLLFEGCATPENTGNWQISGLAGSTFTIDSPVNCTIGSYSGGTQNFTINGGATTTLVLRFSVLPVGGLAGIKCCHVDDVAKTQILSDSFIQRYGYHPTLRPNNPRAWRMMKNYRGEKLARRTSAGVLVPQGSPVNTGYNIAKQAHELGAETIYLSGPMDMTHEEAEAVLEGIASYSSWTGTLYLSFGNEVMWNFPTYPEQCNYLLQKAAELGFVSGVPAGTIATVDWGASADRTYISYGGNILSEVPPDTYVVTYCDNNGSGKSLLLRSKRTLTPGVTPAIHVPTFVAGYNGSDDWQCLGDTNTLFPIGNRYRVVHTGTMRPKGRAILGDRFKTAIDLGINQTVSFSVNMIDTTALDGTPMWPLIDVVGFNPYLYVQANVSTGSAWQNLYQSDYAAFASGAIDAQRAWITTTQNSMNALIAGFAARGASSYSGASPIIVTYEAGPHMTIGLAAGYTWDEAALTTAWVTLANSDEHRLLVRDHTYARLTTEGLAADYAFVDYARPRKSGSGRFEMFGLQYAPGGADSKALTGWREAVALAAVEGA